MEISVIIPTYKPKEYLYECLNSLYIQSLSKDSFELVLILNGCSNPWKNQIQDWIVCHSDLKIKFIQTDTSGVSNARNIGLHNATGKYIAFIDDDDYVSPHYLEGLLEAVDDDSLVLSDSCAFNDNNPDIILDSYPNHLSYLNCKKHTVCSFFHARTLFNGPCMKLINRKFIYGIQFDTSLSVGEDSVFMFAISKDIRNLKFAKQEALYYRRFRDNSAFTTKHSLSFWIINCLKIQSKILSYWIQCPWKYNFTFTLTRILAPLKSIFRKLFEFG